MVELECLAAVKRYQGRRRQVGGSKNKSACSTFPSTFDRKWLNWNVKLQLKGIKGGGCELVEARTNLLLTGFCHSPRLADFSPRHDFNFNANGLLFQN